MKQERESSRIKGIINRAVEEDGSIHIVHKDAQTIDDFSLNVVKTDAYKTMTNN
ncbi:hypothetical protein ACFYKX_07705 [Cytobacillus sp. FJAT-54145]|uniref:DUF2187 domain-containing protein n=1 Tax=Cytobacillus spartinae TaxID=3299023 RepID=A0ABW6KA82_9BACI